MLNMDLIFDLIGDNIIVRILWYKEKAFSGESKCIRKY